VSTRIRFLGCSGFEVIGPSRRILVDPFLTQNPKATCAVDELATPDVLLVTHAAPDHSGDAAAIARRTGCPVVCGPDVRLALLEDGIPERQIRATMWGIAVEVGGIRVKPLVNAHFSLVALEDGARVTGLPLSYLFDAEPGIRVFHSGDTAFYDMSAYGRLYRPDIALLGTSLPVELLSWAPGAGTIVSGEMDGEEAAVAFEMLGARIGAAHHYLEPDDEARRFVEHASRRDNHVAYAPQAGQTIVIDSDRIYLED
jgi:L-ascorbate metabolism protein UlaG (beta-lactamase superfamily)